MTTPRTGSVAMTLTQRLIGQFEHPRGVLGRLAGRIMATRRSNRLRNDWTLDLLDLTPEHRVLEIGFGPGYAIEQAAGRVGRGRVYGLDHSATMLDQAQRRNAPLISAGRVILRQGDAVDLGWLPEALDRVYSVNVVQFWPELPAVLTAIYGALRPGGIVATTYMPRGPNAAPDQADAMASRISAALRAAGFDELQIRRLPVQPMPAICVLGRRPAID
jgi:ubiquinone/menaquinone biosynthesis C-methylase UbiE